MRKLFVILLLILPLSAQGSIYAVLVGVSEYGQNIGNLACCHRDAMAMYALLKEHTTPNKMILMVNQQATLEAVVDQTIQLFSKAKAGDMVVFFFSGHGYSDFFCLHNKNLHFSVLQKIFKDCKAKQKVIFADACYAGTLRTEGDQAALAASSKGSNVMLFLSSRNNQRSAESPFLQNGRFTYFLLAGLKGGADANKDGCITAKELFDFVYPKVKEDSRGSQIPVMWGRFDKHMIILKRKPT